jgi:hypothetical protein
MMTGLAGAAMWLMMGLMLLGLAAGAITWTRRRLHRRHDDQPPPTDQTPLEFLQRRYAARGDRPRRIPPPPPRPSRALTGPPATPYPLALDAALAGRSADRLTRDFSFQ